MGDTSGYAHSESEHGGETTSTGKSERGNPRDESAGFYGNG